jgi:hypothetical protein
VRTYYLTQLSMNLSFKGVASTANPTGITEVNNNSPLPVYSSVGQNLATKTVTFTGAAGLGAIGTTSRFTVTGVVSMRIFAVSTVNAVGATATIAAGTAGNTAALIAQTAATNLAAGKIWQSATPLVGVAALTTTPESIVTLDIIETVATAAITAGSITYYCLWSPVSAGATVTAI